MTRRHALAVLVVAAVVAAPRVGRASPADLFGFGPKSQALAGTGAAIGEGFEATYGNPARLSLARKRQLSLGWQVARFRLEADGPRAPGRMSTEGLRGSFIGAVLPLPFGGALEDRLALGLGVFTPKSLIVRARLLHPERAQFPVLADRAQSLSFNLGLGADLGYGVRIGGGALVLAELVGTVTVRTDASGAVGTLVDDQLVATYAPIAGATVDLGRGYTAGLTWRGELEGEFDVTVKVFDLGELVLPDLSISGVAQYDPMQLQAEVSSVQGPWTLAIGATYKRWSAFEGWSRPTVRCPGDQPDCGALDVADVNFDDTLVPRFAVVHELPLAASAVGKLRGGYFFEPSPAPEQTGASNYWDNHRHVVTVGYGIELSDPLVPLQLDLFYQHHFLAPRTHTKSDQIDPSNPGAPKVRTSGTVQNAGLVVGVQF